MQNNKMKIAIGGASGFIGSYLTQYFKNKGHEIYPLSRKVFSNELRLESILSDSDIVINLTGAPINHRWTDSYKRELYDSRIIPTRNIVKVINELERRPKLFISISAVGYYSSKGCYNEYNSVKGDNFLSDLCERWEGEAKQVSPKVRLIIARLGVVLAAKGGAFGKMMLPAKLGLVTIIGKGSQPFPWISIVDLTHAMEYMINNLDVSGVVNLVVPEQITNKKLMEMAAKHYRSFLTIKIPTVIFRILLGEAATFTIGGQCVEPKKLLESGFVYQTPTISDFFLSISMK